MVMEHTYQVSHDAVMMCFDLSANHVEYMICRYLEHVIHVLACKCMSLGPIQ